MAWLEKEKTGIYQICFRFRGERIKRSARTRALRKAETLLARVEENIDLVERGRLIVPCDADLFPFLVSDGKINDTNAKTITQVRLAKVFERYSESLPANAMSMQPLRIAGVHMRHIVRILGRRCNKVRSVSRDDLQHYINVRSKESGQRNRSVSADTIRKELATFGTLWKWAKQSDFVSADFPKDGLRFPRSREKYPFSTWNQIEQRISRGVPKGLTEADLWDCLYLSTKEIDELLEFVRKESTYDFLYPMCFMAAHTGARRSELCRSLQDDVDLENNTILINEKKRQKGRETFRHVPMSPRLAAVLQEWLSPPQSSRFTFPAEYRVFRVRNCNRRENSESVAPDEATDHLEKTLAGSRWEKIRGWHVFRHSFISNCASRSVDQRMIDSWVGHQTEEMRRRYRHLFPSSQRQELSKVFG